MRLTVNQLRRIIAEEVGAALAETREFATPDELRMKFEELYGEAGEAAPDDLADALGVPVEALDPVSLYRAGLGYTVDGGIVDVQGAEDEGDEDADMDSMDADEKDMMNLPGVDDEFGGEDEDEMSMMGHRGMGGDEEAEEEAEEAEGEEEEEDEEDEESDENKKDDLAERWTRLSGIIRG